MLLHSHISSGCMLPVPMGLATRRCQYGFSSRQSECLRLRAKQLGRIPSLGAARIPSTGHPHSNSRLQRRSRCRLSPILATASAAALAPSQDEGPKGHLSLFSAPLQAWDSWWSLGREPKNEKAQRARKLGCIASKLWKIMEVNGLMLAAALFCMVSFLVHSLRSFV